MDIAGTTTKIVVPAAAATASQGNGEANGVSGFVLKLFGMINGAEDDIVSVSFFSTRVSEFRIVVVVARLCFVRYGERRNDV